MPNALLTSKKITKAAARLFMNQLGFGMNINWDWTSEFGQKQAQIGDTVQIRKPVQPKVIQGATYTPQAISEGQVTLAVARHYQVPLEFSQYDMTLSIEEFADRFIKPATTVLSAQMDADLYAMAISGNPTTSLLGNAVSNCAANQVVGAYGTALVSSTVGKSMQFLDEHSAPADDRYGILTPAALQQLRDNQIAFFNPAGSISSLYKTGKLGSFYGAEWESSQSALAGSRTNGAWAGSPVIASASSLTAGWQPNYTLTVNGFTAGTTVKAGDVFTIANVYDVNPLNKRSLGYLKQWVVLADVASAAATGQQLLVAPFVGDPTNGYANISVAPSNGAALTLVGTASTSGQESLVFHRDAFAAASPKFDLPKASSVQEAYNQRIPSGPNIAFTRTWDAVNFRWIQRLDVLAAFAMVTPEWAVRIRS